MRGFFEGFLGMKVLILVGLAGGFTMLFGRIRWLELCAGFLRQTRQYMDEAERHRLLDNRQLLQSLTQEHSLWFRLERRLQYSGWKRRLPWLTVERWLAGNIVALCGIFILCLVAGNLTAAVIGMGLFLLIQLALAVGGQIADTRAVNENLMKFLDFLGNYSLTAGEITSVFKSVSKYVDEPLKSALDACYYEAQTTGDTPMALLAMAEKIEHPKFKELVRNMEISMRYSADFTVLVQSSRRSMREYLRSGAERKGLLREAVVNMALLLGLSLFIFLTVDGLIETSIWQVLFGTLPGRIGLGVLIAIFALFGRQIYKVQH